MTVRAPRVHAAPGASYINDPVPCTILRVVSYWGYMVQVLW